MIEFKCTNCSGALKVADSLAGERVRCGHCKATQRVPAATWGQAEQSIEDSAAEATRRLDLEAPTPPPIYRGDPIPVQTRPAFEVPEYSAMYTISMIASVIGALVFFLGLSMIFFGIAQLASGVGGDRLAGISILAGAVACCAWGVIVLAAGEGLKAFRDMAQNSWRQLNK